MNKILINLHVPSAQQRFDLFAPPDLRISTLTELLENGAKELCGDRYLPTQPHMLVLRNPEEVLLNPENTLLDYNTGDGAELILF